MAKLKIVALCGSLRRESYNKALLKAAVESVPNTAEIEILEIGHLPLFNQDFEEDLPPEVEKFKDKIKSADAVLFVSPEYNYSIPGVLKNAIDWGSRPYSNNSFSGKPALIMGASIGVMGTARMQYHLRQTMVFLNMHPLNTPEVMVGPAQQRFDNDGKLTDERTKEKVIEALEALIDWTQKLQKLK